MDVYKHREICIRTIFTLDRRIWHEGLVEPRIAEFEAQFQGRHIEEQLERALVIELLAHFVYFGSHEVEYLAKALYRDSFRYPLVEQYRRNNGDTLDRTGIVDHLEEKLLETRFVALGGGAGSGNFIAYIFRTQNRLPEELFTDARSISQADAGDYNSIRRIVVLDDVCGSGKTAVTFGESEIAPIVQRFKQEGLPAPEVNYLALCGTGVGLRIVGESPVFTRAETAVYIDESYRVCGSESRYFGAGKNLHEDAISLEDAKAVLTLYGTPLFPRHPLGYRDGQLLIGFSHNIPNNSLPVMWSIAGDPAWIPPFERHGKAPNVAAAAAMIPR